MKKNKTNFIIFILLLFSLNFAQSQTKKNSIQTFNENANCNRKRNLSFKNRINNFPFNLTSQIIFVSHKTKEGPVGRELRKYLNSLKIGQDTINEKEFLELKKINLNQIEKLTDIIFNYGFKSKYHSIKDAKCYDPRNAILFLNKENEIIAFIEICFGCDHLRTSDVKIDFGEYCKQKFDLIKKIFAESGIKFGIIEN